MTVMRAARTLGQLSGWTLSNLPLQKTLYVAQMIHLSETGGPLFHEDVEAWDYGPVVPSVYRLAKPFKRDAVQDVFPAAAFSRDDPEFFTLCEAWNVTKDMMPGELVTYTHRRGGAWEQFYDPRVRNQVIPLDAILREVNHEARASDGAVAWAESVAAQLEKAPTRYLDDAEQRAFRARLFGEIRQQSVGSC